mmetsp:Transcript_97806/g.282199  ORF Transcript_97806/g.282199 Transcript_97806/m.282199 type:complete len:367 (+) Transcript_97806:115-1215(+)
MRCPHAGSDVESLVPEPREHLPIVFRTSIHKRLPRLLFRLCVNNFPILKIADLHHALPNQDAMILQLRRSHLLVVVIIFIIVILLILRPLDPSQHQLLVALDSPRASLHDDDVGNARASNTTTCEVKLLGIHVNLEQVPLVSQVPDLEDQHLRRRLCLGKPLLFLLRLTLLGRQLPRLVSLLVLLPPLLDLLANLALHCRRICDRLITEHSHQVGHLYLRRRRLQDPHLDLITDFLRPLLPLQPAQLFALLWRKVHHRRLGHFLLSGDLNRDRVLHIGCDFLDVHLSVCSFLAVHVLFEKRQVPPLDIRNRLPPHDLRLNLPHAKLCLWLLLFLLLFLTLLRLLLFLVHAKGFLLHLFDHPLLLLH